MGDNISVHSNARKGPDLILRLIDLFSVILWGFLIFNVGVIISAKPQVETFLDRFFHVSVREHWDFRLLQLALILSLAQFVISLFSLYLNSKRLKRKHDRIRVSIIISLIASLILCILLTATLFFIG